MAELNDWDVAAANNNSAPPDGWPENMNYSEVNNSARENMAVTRRFFGDINGSLAAGGLVNAYTLTLNASYAALFDGLIFACTIPITSTSTTPTINVNAIGAATIVDTAGAALKVGALVAGELYFFLYDGTNMRLFNGGSDTKDPVVSGHIRAGNTQVIDRESTTTGITISAVVTEATFETVGPTGSGADNIWATMDQIPANATILLVNVGLVLSTASAATAGLNVYVSNGDDATPAASNTSTRIAGLGIDSDADIDGNSELILDNVMIPLGPTNQDFHIYWDATQHDAATVILYYRGFMTD